MEPEEQSKLAQATQAILKAKNLTVNSASGRLGIDRGVLTRMHDYGTPPRLDVLERFARSLRLDVNEWRVLAGYEPVGAAPADASGVEILDAGMYQLSQRVGRLLPYNGHINRETLTPAEARRQLADIEAELREEGLLTD